MWLLAFLAIGAGGGVICVRLMMIQSQMIAQLNVVNPGVKRDIVLFEMDRGMRFVREYRKLVPDGKLNAKWRHCMWACGVWVVLAVVLIFGPWRLPPHFW